MKGIQQLPLLLLAVFGSYDETKQHQAAVAAFAPAQALSKRPSLFGKRKNRVLGTHGDESRSNSETTTNREQQTDAQQIVLCETTDPETYASYLELHQQVKTIAEILWDGEEIPFSIDNNPTNENSNTIVLLEGEAAWDNKNNRPFRDRAEIFRQSAFVEGCPYAQHSYGLLLWSGFGGVAINPQASTKFHASAAAQHHLDALAVLGGILRTGTGIPKVAKRAIPYNRIELGLKLINFCANTLHNPTGINKLGRLLESNGNEQEARELYERCFYTASSERRINALLFFNLGWSLIHYHPSNCDEKQKHRGLELWKEATQLAPCEGSEEAAWNLYLECLEDGDDPKEALRWKALAEDLGYNE